MYLYLVFIQICLGFQVQYFAKFRQALKSIALAKSIGVDAIKIHLSSTLI